MDSPSSSSPSPSAAVGPASRPGSDPVQLVWFRDDLRIADQPALAVAAARGPVTCLAVVDPAEYAPQEHGFPRQGAMHARFRLESIANLRRRLEAIGGSLLVRVGDPVSVVAAIAAEAGATVVHANAEPCTEERARERGVRRALAAQPEPARLELHAGSTLVDPQDLPLTGGRPPRVFTKFRRIVEKKLTIAPPHAAPRVIRSGPPLAAGPIPTLGDLRLDPPVDDPRRPLPLSGGETAGLARLEDWIFTGDHLRSYKQTRNGMLGAACSSKFSPWLAHGCLGPRTIHAAVKRYERERVRNDSTAWLVVELLWRDFFRLVAADAGPRLFAAGGLRGLRLPWSRDPERYAAWREGRTGVPIVDANMRELAATGFMSNRGRQVVASFLAKNLGVDWRLGAAWFQSRLVDHDPSSNWGNWAYVAGVGNDAREFRWFNPMSQGARYDAEGEHARTWIPALEQVPGHRVHELGGGDGPAVEGYPAPMVDVMATADDARVRHEIALGVDASDPG